MEVFENNDYKQGDIGVVDFPYICRICLMQGDLRSLESEDYLLDLFRTITKIDVRSTTELPRNICQKCISKLKDISTIIEFLKCKKAMPKRDTEITTSLEGATEIKKESADDYEEDTYDETCRICLSSSNLTPLKENAHLTQLFLNIHIKPDIDFAYGYSICKTCMNKLVEISSFIGFSLSNNEKLESAFSRNKAFQSEGNSKGRRFDFGLARFCDIKIENTVDVSEVKVEKDLDESIYETTDMPEYFDVKKDIPDQNCEDKSVSTQICFKEEPNESGIHNDNFTIEKPFKCNCCKESFSEKALLQQHMLTHPEERPFECELCQKRFANKKGLRKHLYVHSEKRPFKCDSCDKRFPRKYHLERHLVIHTGEKSFQCHLCQKTFNRDTNLQQHYQTHVGNKPFRCTYCDKSFSLKHHVERHVLTHTGEKPFKCEYCEKSFGRKTYLQQHYLIHTGEKPFKCDFCEKQFALRHHVKQHMITHTGEKAFSCDLCEKQFALKVTLQRHLLVHSGSKPFECELCDRRFIRNYLLQKHMRIHAGKNHQT